MNSKNEVKTVENPVVTLQSIHLPEVNSLNQVEPLIERIMKKATCGNHINILMVSAMLIFTEGLQVSLSGLLFVPLMYKMNLNNFEACLAISVMFVGMCFGSIFSGLIAEKGRKLAIITSLIVLLICTFFSAIDWISLFIILRALVGFALGIIIPMINSLLIEYLSTYCRGFWICFISSFFFLGAIYTCLMMNFIYLKDWEGIDANSASFFFWLSVPIIFTIFIAIFKLEESPRKLLTSKKYEEAFRILEKINRTCLTEEEKTRIIKESAKENKNIGQSISALFQGKLKKTSIILTLVWIFYSYLVNGGLFQFMAGLLYSSSLSPEYLNKNYNNHSLALAIFYSFFIIMNLLSGCLTEIKCIGRKGLICFGFMSSVLACVIFFLINIPSGLEFFPAAIFVNMSMQITQVYTSEIYPTKVRDLALGFFYFISRLTGFISNILILFLLETNVRNHIIFNMVIGICGFILTLRLPVETFRRALDSKIIEKVERNQVNSEILVNTSINNTTTLDEEL